MSAPTSPKPLDGQACSELVSSERWVRQTEARGGCIIWTGYARTNGYGVTYLRGRVVSTHRVAYAAQHGGIPEGMQLDHLCRVTLCVNPDHLEAVTARENNRRSNSATAVHARKTHCPKGHPLDGPEADLADSPSATAGGFRICRKCNIAKSAELTALVRAAANALGVPVSHYVAMHGRSRSVARSFLEAAS